MISIPVFSFIAVAVVFVGGYLWFRPGKQARVKDSAKQVGMNSEHKP